MLVLVMLVPQADASFTETPLFDLKTSSNLAGATDALYTLHVENRDQSEDAASLFITIPEDTLWIIDSSQTRLESKPCPRMAVARMGRGRRTLQQRLL